MIRYTRRLLILLALTVTTGTFAFQQEPHAQSATLTGGDAWSAAMESMQRMDADMASVAPSGDPDVDFVRLMIPHHAAAIDMAKVQLKYGKDPQARRLAQEIITDQQLEIELMRLWLGQTRTKPDAREAAKRGWQ